MTNTTTQIVEVPSATELQQVERLHEDLAIMYRSMRDIAQEIQQHEDTPGDVRERILNFAERFCFTVAQAADEITRSQWSHDATHRAFINLRRAVFSFHDDIVVPVREWKPDSWALTVLHCLGKDLVGAFYDAAPLMAKLGGWYFEGFEIGTPWKPVAHDPRLAECIVNE